jgi:hypothetical protein
MEQYLIIETGKIFSLIEGGARCVYLDLGIHPFSNHTFGKVSMLNFANEKKETFPSLSFSLMQHKDK